MTNIKSLAWNIRFSSVIVLLTLLSFVASFNKLGLDTITTGEDPNPSNQVEEVNSYRPVRSEPLCSEKIVHLDIGTAHSVAVTGEIDSLHLITPPFVAIS